MNPTPSRPRLQHDPADETLDHQRLQVLKCLRAAPTGGGALRRRIGKSVARVIAEMHACGLIVRDSAGEWWLTAAGREALRLAQRPDPDVDAPLVGVRVRPRFDF